MKVLFVSGELTGSGLCQKLLKEGNEVKLYIHKPDWKQCYSGIVEKINDWMKHLDWVGKDGLIIFDDVIFGSEQDELRAQGYTVIGSSKGGDELELQRKLFHDVAESLNLNTLDSYDFETVADAINFLESAPDRWVLKQSSHLSFLNFIGTATDGSDIIEKLQQYQDRGIAPIHLQKYADGIEIGVARYFNGTDWVGPIEINHEHKKLKNGDVGSLTPEMGTVMWYTENEDLPLYKKTLSKFKPYLQQIAFHGDFDINFIVNENNLWPLEATPRFGAPSTQLQVALHHSPWSEFLESVGKGLPYNLEYKNGYGVVVSIVVDPFPYEPNRSFSEAQNDFTKKRILFSEALTPEEFNHIHFEEVSQDENGFYWSGNYGIVLHVTAHASTIAAAKDAAYTLIKKIHVDGMYYRTDIGERVAEIDLPTLKKWEWI